jgi:hypothetical protein
LHNGPMWIRPKVIKALPKKGQFKSGTCNMKKGWLKQKLGLANESELKMKGWIKGLCIHL